MVRPLADGGAGAEDRGLLLGRRGYQTGDEHQGSGDTERADAEQHRTTSVLEIVVAL